MEHRGTGMDRLVAQRPLGDRKVVECEGYALCKYCCYRPKLIFLRKERVPLELRVGMQDTFLQIERAGRIQPFGTATVVVP